MQLDPNSLMIITSDDLPPKKKHTRRKRRVTLRPLAGLPLFEIGLLIALVMCVWVFLDAKTVHPQPPAPDQTTTTPDQTQTK